jgi:hypothetical protein
MSATTYANEIIADLKARTIDTWDTESVVRGTRALLVELIVIGLCAAVAHRFIPGAIAWAFEGHQVAGSLVFGLMGYVALSSLWFGQVGYLITVKVFHVSSENEWTEDELEGDE